MNKPELAFDICRSYIQDNPHVNHGLLAKVSGYNRSRDYPKLSESMDLFDVALHNVDDFRFLRQISAFFKKNAGFVDKEVTRSAALKNFDECERKCKRVNKRLDFYFLHHDRIDPDVKKQIDRAQSYIRRILGPFGRHSSSGFLNKLPQLVRLTGGASSHFGRKQSLPYMKVRGRGYCTARAWPYIDALQKFWGYKGARASFTEYNRVEVVPKSWKTDRTIACEPMWNIPLQLAFDTYAKGRLKRYAKIDLADQEVNQELARIGSIENSLATVDMKAASDTIAYNAVAWLFPTPWFRYLDDIRSTFYMLEEGDDVRRKYEKFSSMGNGSTFAIETLIFASLCYAVGCKTFNVYGDDIVIESVYYDKFLRLAEFFGFSLNQDKSFTDGPFRESCGTDWFDGTNVTPVFLRDMDSRKAILSHNVNTMSSIALPGGRLQTLLSTLVEKENLLLIPWNGVSTSGVWIDVTSAYELNLIKKDRENPWLYQYKTYQVIDKAYAVYDSRALFLWHLDASRTRAGEVKVSKNFSIIQRSKVSHLKHRYVRKWVSWTSCPTMTTPVHLYVWAEHLKRVIG